MPTVDHLLFLMENKAATWRIRLAAVSRAFMREMVAAEHVTQS